MDSQLKAFVENHGIPAAQKAVERYRETTPEFDEAWSVPMHFASGYTAAHLAELFSIEWIRPLRRQARMAGISALTSLVLLLVAMFYVWSLVDFSSFGKFLAAFAPAVAMLVLSAAKSYKAWADARKSLAEASSIVASGQRQ
jgi:hypothetical protein